MVVKFQTYRQRNCVNYREKYVVENKREEQKSIIANVLRGATKNQVEKNEVKQQGNTFIVMNLFGY